MVRIAGIECPAAFFCAGGIADKAPCDAMLGKACPTGTAVASGKSCDAGTKARVCSYLPHQTFLPSSRRGRSAGGPMASETAFHVRLTTVPTQQGHTALEAMPSRNLAQRLLASTAQRRVLNPRYLGC